jgi:hypothetical protein
VTIEADGLTTEQTVQVIARRLTEINFAIGQRNMLL